MMTKSSSQLATDPSSLHFAILTFQFPIRGHQLDLRTRLKLNTTCPIRALTRLADLHSLVLDGARGLATKGTKDTKIASAEHLMRCPFQPV